MKKNVINLFDNKEEKNIHEQFSYKDFTNEIYGDLINEYNVRIQDEEIYVLGESLEFIRINIKDMYSRFLELEDYQQTLREYKEIFKKVAHGSKEEIDLISIYPVLRTSNYSYGDLLEKKLFCDLSFYYVEENHDFLRYVTKNHDSDEIHAVALRNLNKITNPLVALEETGLLFGCNFTTYITPSLIVSEEYKKIIEKSVGRDYVFCFPSTTTLLIAKYKEELRADYIELLSRLMEEIEGEKITNNIYLYKNGEYTFLDKNKEIEKLANDKHRQILKSKEYLFNVFKDGSEGFIKVVYGNQINELMRVINNENKEEFYKLIIDFYNNKKTVETIFKDESDSVKHVKGISQSKNNSIQKHMVTDKIPASELYYSENLQKLIFDFSHYYINKKK